jgi:hypothetical protein
VKDKINYRARGPNTVLTRQPVQGRANDGGLRIGEMERDGVLAHGMSYFLNESFMVRGEKSDFFIAVCNKTGAIAIYNESKNLFLSPSADGPINFNTNPDGSMNIKNLSRFGRSFSILRVPYSLKLLIQELQVLNIQMRLITEDNVDQLLSMSYSQNITKLMNMPDNSNLKEVIDNYVEQIKSTIEMKKINPVVVETPELPEPVEIDSKSPEYANVSPAYQPGSPEYAPYSPAYQPGSPEYANVSPAYQPGSPEYSNVSPAYQQGSPEYAPYSPAYQPGSPEYANVSPAYQPGSPAYQPGSPAYNPGSPTYEPNFNSNNSKEPPLNQTILDVDQPKEEILEKKSNLDSSLEENNNSLTNSEKSSSEGTKTIKL